MPEPVLADEQNAQVTVFNDPPADTEPAPVGLWQRLREMLGGNRQGRLTRRLDALTEAIAASPESATNYVLRGEVFYQLGEYALAVTDFEFALRLATDQFDRRHWGIVSQAMRDRALDGLMQAARHVDDRMDDE